MPISVDRTAGDTGFVDIRVGDGHGIHQQIIDVATQTATDVNGYLPPGVPLQASGVPVTNTATVGTQVVAGVVGPESVKLGAANHFGNAILTGVLNRDAIEDNLGRVLSANEIAAFDANDAIVLV